LSGRPNVIATWGRGASGAKSLTLNSHIDVVSWEEGADAWSVHPLAGEVRDDRIIGRGAVDAKGQIVAACMALLGLRDAGLEPEGTVTLMSVVDEEPGGNGTLAACLEGLSADAAIVLEPTGNHVAYGHRGIVDLRVTVQSAAGHGAVAGAAPGGAVVRAADIIPALSSVLHGWHAPQDAVYGPPSLNIGRIEGGEDIFSVPRRCTLDAGLRYAPGTGEAVLAAARDGLARAGVVWDEDSAPEVARVVSHYDAAETPPAHPLIQGLLGAAQRFAPGATLTTFPGGCDARHLVNRGGIPTAIFGAGELASAHRADEAVPIAELVTTAQTLAWFIMEWAGCHRNGSPAA
jgi:acetylornithine deacetylase